MSINAEVNEAPKESLSYPFIGIHHHERRVVLFTAQGEGVVLKEGINDNKNCHYRLGSYHATFIVDYYDPFNGEILLKNSK